MLSGREPVADLFCHPRFVIQSFALEHGTSPDIADWLLSIMNLSGVLGRTIPNWLADRYGTLEVSWMNASMLKESMLNAIILL